MGNAGSDVIGWLAKVRPAHRLGSAYASTRDMGRTLGATAAGSV